MIDIAPEVQRALDAGAPVVALESTIIAHGLPFPDNLELARELEETVRAGGAVPATIAVLRGRATVGLDGAALDELARRGPAVAKAGGADLAVHMAAGGSAATTVSATAALAARAGIRVFATGGIGGVHRGSELDVSSDLTALAALPIAVVSAGPKAILDLERTSEALETLGVLVVGYRTDELPAFYCRRSGIALEHRIDTAEDAARLLEARWQLLGQGGVLVANPVPEAVAIDAAEVGRWVADAETAAAAAGVAGKALTPFLLAHIAQVSGGRAVATNRALARSNAAVAAEIAAAYAARPARPGDAS